MQKDMKVQSSHPLPSEDAELRDILIAISVVAKRLATNLENQNMEGERQHEQNERIVRVTGRDPPDRRQAYCSAACAKKAHRRQQREYMRKKRGASVDN
ncbi:hypothetical protein [Blautia massiliensis (ex Durand et al. 2017)]|uniref:hypothetical protein n=1 Tax=Blautia massiliensis (ex Durand et al. 2017) TaxID=1737424 RepID=UPI00399CCA9D